MKKLLSLLSVLTITGTSAPTLIAASPYKKEEKTNDLRQFKEKKPNDLKNTNKIIIIMKF